jgi:DNA-binding NarL/FixJ family response regulator
MNMVEIQRTTAFAVVGITAAFVVPTSRTGAETDSTDPLVGDEVLKTLQSVLAGWMQAQFAPGSLSAQDEGESEEPSTPALRSVATLPDFGERLGRVHTCLTEREREVLCLVAGGATNREVASRLFMSPKTASVHVSRILTKLDAATRTEAAALAHASGLVRLPDEIGPLAVNA